MFRLEFAIRAIREAQVYSTRTHVRKNECGRGLGGVDGVPFQPFVSVETCIISDQTCPSSLFLYRLSSSLNHLVCFSRLSSISPAKKSRHGSRLLYSTTRHLTFDDSMQVRWILLATLGVVAQTAAETPRAVAADASTIKGKYMYGYQGWFRSPNQGLNTHWSTNGKVPGPGNGAIHLMTPYAL